MYCHERERERKKKRREIRKEKERKKERKKERELISYWRTGVRFRTLVRKRYLKR